MSIDKAYSLSWFRVDVDVVDHPKIDALAANLKDPNAGWYVVRLWSWTMRYAPSGLLPQSARQSIERACGWRGTDGELLAALVQTGWLIEFDSGELEVHDWDEHQGAAVAKAQKDIVRKRTARAVPRTGAGLALERRADGAGTRRDETRRDETNRVPSPKSAPPLELVSQSPHKPKVEKTTDPRHAVVVADIDRAFRTLKGTGYPFAKVDFKRVSELLKRAEPQALLEAWQRALHHQGFPTIGTLEDFAKHLPRFLGSGASTGPPRGVAQPSLASTTETSTTVTSGF